MRVLLLNTLYPPHVHGGAERSVQELAESLAHQGDEAIVATTGGGGRGVDPRPVNGVKLLYLPIANFYWPFDGSVRSCAERKLWHIVDVYNPVMKAAVTDLIAAERPDVVHTNNLQAISVAAWAAARAARVPILHTLRDYYLTCARCTRYRDGRNCQQTCWDCLPFMLARRRVSACVAGVVGVSRFMLDHHREQGFFPNAHFHSVIYQTPSASSSTHNKRAVGTLKFGYLGRITRDKGIDMLLAAFANRKDSGWELRIAGEGNDDYNRFLRERYAALESRGVLRFLGWMDSEKFLSEIDVLVVPSLWNEPLARVIGEAFGAGVAVIASRSGGNPELIEDGTTGRLFDCDDPQALSRIVDEFLRNSTLSRRLGENARRRLQDATAENARAKYREAYDAISRPAAKELFNNR